MPSLDFEAERDAFREFYNDNSMMMEEAKSALIELISALLRDQEDISVSKIDGRVKDREECIAKFIRKYRTKLEADRNPYEIKEHITDLLGVRVVCLYESDIEKVVKTLERELDTVSITNKTAEIEETDATFGYKGIHADCKLKGARATFSEYKRFADLKFEVQIRTLVQDAWSVIDHKIKYKKSIPQNLKRRVNTLAALFELADREFLEIKNETAKHVEEAEESYPDIEKESEKADNQKEGQAAPRFTPATLDAFSFQKIANHFFPEYQFEDRKVDGFVEEIQWQRPRTTRGKFNFYLKHGITAVKEYANWKNEHEGRHMNPFTLMRHCLYLGDPGIFRDALTESAREEFNAWLSEKEGDPDIEQ